MLSCDWRDDQIRILQGNSVVNHGTPSCMSSANIPLNLQEHLLLEQRTHKAAPSSFIDAVIDWYDFYFGIVATLIFKYQFSQVWLTICGNLLTIIVAAIMPKTQD